MEIVPGAICSECAMAGGAEWPRGHIATFWMGKCSRCELERACCCVTDYDWPGRKLKSNDIEREI